MSKRIFLIFVILIADYLPVYSDVDTIHKLYTEIESWEYYNYDEVIELYDRFFVPFTYPDGSYNCTIVEKIGNDLYKIAIGEDKKETFTIKFLYPVFHFKGDEGYIKIFNQGFVGEYIDK